MWMICHRIGGEIHKCSENTVKALESGTVILEMKNGKYEPTGEEDILK